MYGNTILYPEKMRTVSGRRLYGFAESVYRGIRSPENNPWCNWYSINEWGIPSRSFRLLYMPEEDPLGEEFTTKLHFNECNQGLWLSYMHDTVLVFNNLSKIWEGAFA